MLAEQHDEWADGRRYLGLDVIARLQTANTITPDNNANDTAIDAPEATINNTAIPA